MKSKPTYQELEKEIESLRKEKAEVSNDLKKKIFNSINDGIYINSPDYTIEYLNEPMIKMLGGDKTGQKCYKAVYNIDKICEWCIFEKLKKDDTITHELKHPSTNNTYIIKNSLLDNGSKVTSYHDISELKKNELQLQKQNNEITSLNEEYATINEEYKTTNEQLLIAKENAEASEEIFKAIFNNANDSIVLINIETMKFEMVNDNVYRMLGYKPDEFLELSIPEIHPTENIPDIIKEFEKSIKGKNRFVKNIPIKCKNGNIIITDIKTSIVVLKGKTYQLSIVRDVTEQKKTEKALKESEEKYKSIIENMTDIYYRANINREVTIVSQSALNALGYNSLNEIIGKNLANSFYYSLDDSKKLFNAIQKNGEVKNYHVILKHKNGKPIDFETNTKIIFDKTGKHIGSEGILRNITEQKEAEQNLIETKNELMLANKNLIEQQSIFMVGNVVIFKWQNKEGWPVEYVSENVENIFGFNQEEFISGKVNFANLINKDDIEKVSEEIIHAINNNLNSFEHTEYRITNKHREEVWLYDFTTIIRNGKNEITHFFGYVMNVTDRKKAELGFRKLSEVAKQSSASIVITDTDGKIEFANPFFTKITGYTFEEAKGKNPRILKSEHTTKEEYKELWDTITSGKTWQGEFLNIKKNKKKYWEKAIISPITNDSGKIINYVAIKEDITEKKKAGQALKKSEAELRESNQTKDKFFSIIAHDLINPFNAILGFSNLLLENHKKYDAEKREEMIKYVNKSANNAFKLLENLLTWSRSQSGAIKYSPEKLHLKILLFETMFNLQGEADRKNIHILDDISENELIFADKNMITTVLRNLISNAIKFTNNGGSIIISSKKQTNSNFLEISVEDTGVGIPKDRIDDLFRIDKNTSTQGTENETGTGLGLILCKEFAEKHGSKIWAESEIGKGSKFIITMPNIYN